MIKNYFLLMLVAFALPTKAIDPCDTLPQPTIVLTSGPSCDPSFCDPTYSLEVTVSSGTVTSSGGVATHLGANVWAIVDVDYPSDIDVTVTDANSCTAILPVVSPNCGIFEMEPPISGGDKIYCVGEVVPTLNVNVPPGVVYICNWYDAPVGGNLLVADSYTYTPPPGTATYYAEAQSSIGVGISCSRTPIVITEITTTISVVASAGNLFDSIVSAGGNLDLITDLTVTGNIDACDFKLMRDSMLALTVVDLSGATIVAYTGSEGTCVYGFETTYLANTIPYLAFKDRSNLTSITTPSSVISIGDYAFYNCSELISIIIPLSVTDIGQEAFLGCSSLISVIIPSSVLAIQVNAFYSCSSLSSISVYKTTPVDLSSVGSENIFGLVNKTTSILHVPVGTKALYEAAAQWKDFENIVDDLIVTSNNDIVDDKLKIHAAKGVVTIRGLTLGDIVTIYNTSGIPIYNQRTSAKIVTVHLPTRGVYVVNVNGEGVKIVN